MDAEVVFTDEFSRWWDTLTSSEREAMRSKLARLEYYGRRLTAPHSKPLKNTRNGLRELRAYNQGYPLRALYAFVPPATAVVLIGGDKTGDSDFYRRCIPIADDIFDAYIARLETERLGG